MDNLLQILNLLNSQQQPSNSEQANQQPSIPKEILDQYPYGEFPTRYTKSGQEELRIKSENRFSSTNFNDTKPQESNDVKQHDDSLNLNTLLPLIQLMSNNKKQPSDMMKLFSEIIFKDNKEAQQLIKLFSQNKSQEINNSAPFPNTKKVNISSLKRINE